jgi:hypothetical protein
MRDDLENIKGAKERVETDCSTWQVILVPAVIAVPVFFVVGRL